MFDGPDALALFTTHHVFHRFHLPLFKVHTLLNYFLFIVTSEIMSLNSVLFIDQSGMPDQLDRGNQTEEGRDQKQGKAFHREKGGDPVQDYTDCSQERMLGGDGQAVKQHGRGTQIQ